MASRIRQEDIEEETNGIKTPAEKKQQEETQPRVVTEKVVSEISEEQHQYCLKVLRVGCDTLPHGMCGMESTFFKTFPDTD